MKTVWLVELSYRDRCGIDSWERLEFICKDKETALHKAINIARTFKPHRNNKVLQWKRISDEMWETDEYMITIDEMEVV